MKRHLTFGIALSLLWIFGMEFAAQAYSAYSPHESVVIQACKGDKDDDCNG